MPEISDTAKQVPPSSIRKFVPLIDQATTKGISVYKLHIGQPDLESPKEYFEALKNYPWNADKEELFTKNTVAYSKSGGMDAYRRKLAEYYLSHNINVEPKDIIITMGGSEALEMAFKIAANPGEKIISPEPFFLAYGSRAVSENRILVPITTDIRNNFALADFKEKLEGIVKKEAGVKAILINSPNNPTGAVYDYEQMRAVAECALEHNLFVISDEVYREFCFDGKKHVGIMGFPELKNHAIMIDSDSKRYNLCGARLGRLVSKDPNVIGAAMRLAQIRLSVSTIEQIAGTAVLDNPAYVNQVKQEYEQRRNVASGVLSKGKDIMTGRPSGAFYMMVELGKHYSGERIDAEEFVTFMLRDFSRNGKTTSAAPAGEFYVNKDIGKSQVRLAFVINQQELKEACEIFLEGFYSYKNWKQQKRK